MKSSYALMWGVHPQSRIVKSGTTQQYNLNLIRRKQLSNLKNQLIGLPSPGKFLLNPDKGCTTLRYDLPTWNPSHDLIKKPQTTIVKTLQTISTGKTISQAVH